MRFGTLLDVTRPLAPDTRPYPGDPPLALRLLAEHATHGWRTTHLGLSAHAGTHLDAPAHLIPGAATLDAFPLERFLLPARVLDAGDADLVGADLVERAGLAPGSAVLFRTRNSARRDLDPARGFAALGPEAARAVVRAGCTLAGVDGPSVDLLGDPDLPAHHALLGAGVLVLENLDLSQAEPGDWTLACFPLLLPGVEASPVRAVLMR